MGVLWALFLRPPHDAEPGKARRGVIRVMAHIFDSSNPKEFADAFEKMWKDAAISPEWIWEYNKYLLSLDMFNNRKSCWSCGAVLDDGPKTTVVQPTQLPDELPEPESGLGTRDETLNQIIRYLKEKG